MRGTWIALGGLLVAISTTNADTHAPAKAGSAAAAMGSGVGSAAGSAAADDDADLPPHITGPAHVDLGNSSEVELPAGMVLLERDVARKLLRDGGESADNVSAAVIQPGSDWTVLIEYDDVGYVDDSDADKLDAGELLDAYKQGTEQQNIERKKQGTAELTIDGWSEAPNYNHGTHHFSWGIKGHSTEGPIINAFTRVLGRNGFLSMNLVSSPDALEGAKRAAAPLIAATQFKSGARYEDHAGGDKDSGIGLRGLVLGGTGVAIAAKTGLLLKILLVLKKLIIVIVAAVGGFFRWLFGRKKKVTLADAPPPGDPPPSDPPPAV